MDIGTLLFAVGCCVIVARAFDSLGAMVPGSSWGGLYVMAGRAVAILEEDAPRRVDDTEPAALEPIGAPIEDHGAGSTPTYPVTVSPPRWRG